MDSRTDRRGKAWSAAAWLSAMTILIVALLAGHHWLCQREVEPVSRQELTERYSRTLGWIKANEAHVLANSNSALWWMVLASADITGDDYLRGLAQQTKLRLYGDEEPSRPWKRMFDPKASVHMNGGAIEPMQAYQRFFLHALTCVPVRWKEGDTAVFLTEKACGPNWHTVMLGDPACSTHQLMALQVFERSGCTAPQPLGSLKRALLDDVASQLALDPVMKDAHIQRVLMLAWLGQGERIKPIWLRRVLDAQEPDGGWLGHRRLPELPDAISPWAWRERLASQWPGLFSSNRIPLDFHATAQGLLLLALLKNAAPIPVQHSYNASDHQETAP